MKKVILGSENNFPHFHGHVTCSPPQHDDKNCIDMVI